jgi:DNA mismatch endonuclease (patch repair protein)
MSKIRGTNTKPEITIRKALWRKGLRYRLHPKLPGRPDFVFAQAKIAVFIDGCFWHSCPKHSVMPRTNRDFWKNKLHQNTERDQRVNRELRKLGWTVIRYWEHSVKDSPEKVADRIHFKILNRLLRQTPQSKRRTGSTSVS